MHEVHVRVIVIAREEYVPLWRIDTAVSKYIRVGYNMRADLKMICGFDSVKLSEYFPGLGFVGLLLFLGDIWPRDLQGNAGKPFLN